MFTYKENLWFSCTGVEMTKVAYFSMEIGLESSMPTYTGGLGVLAGDTIKSAADVGIPLVGITLLPRQRFVQELNGGQTERYELWKPENYMTLDNEHVTVRLYGRDVGVHAWRYDVEGRKGVVPVYFLDTSGNGNSKDDENIIPGIYQGNRLAQEAVLAIGGMKLLERLGYDPHVFHMNEGHSALLTLYLFNKLHDMEKVRDKCVFTTHSLVAGHDEFNYDEVRDALDGFLPSNVHELVQYPTLHMTRLAMNSSRAMNGVSKKHGAETRKFYNRDDISSITNGVHQSWVCPEFAALYDAELPGWREDMEKLAGASGIDISKIRNAHRSAKQVAVDFIQDKTGVKFDMDLPIVSWARRIVEYKRPWLLFRDPERLANMFRGKGQVVYSGKTHPDNIEGKRTIAYILGQLANLRRCGVNAVYVPDYNMETCSVLSSGSDIWLNTPRVPLEASGTSGMCAALNGVPQLGTLDGWWPEGYQEGETGWAIGDGGSNDDHDAKSLHERLSMLLGTDISNTMRGSIRNGVTHNTDRMVGEYAKVWGV